jgi:hypothetical protein
MSHTFAAAHPTLEAMVRSDRVDNTMNSLYEEIG